MQDEDAGSDGEEHGYAALGSEVGASPLRSLELLNPALCEAAMKRHELSGFALAASFARGAGVGRVGKTRGWGGGGRVFSSVHTRP